MTGINQTWTKEEFKAYLLIYASQSNQLETEDQKEFISSKFDEAVLKNIYREIKNDNDYDRIQKILGYLKQHECTEKDIENLLYETRALYKSDGTFDSVEQSVFGFLEKLLIT